MSPLSSPEAGVAPLNVAVFGAGAVGCFYGGMLARAGHNVTLIARPSHVAAIEANDGLRMQTLQFDERIHLAASTDASAVATSDMVLVAVKSGGTPEAGHQMKPFLRKDTQVFCLQNGVDNAERLRAVLHNTSVSATVVYVATEMAGPGHLRHHGRGELIIEPGPASEQLASALTAAGVPSQVSTNVKGALWAKLVVNCAYNALSAVGQIPYGQLVKQPGIRAIMEDAVSECLAVAAAEGIEIPGDPRAAVSAIAESMAGQRSSTAQDLAMQRPSEIDHLNGYVVRMGEALHLATPVNRALWAAVKLIEWQQQQSHQPQDSNHPSTR
ncbi:2-dehydropantoate 2-reductase [Hydrogenophaga sp. 5NK40-0174]|uniref:ketopantoate reductase family protein n=1 Tax=Hydrogenophaga sp. 5NK40-0174 TaxID=3127649 RepID=UPI003106094F